MTAKEGPSLHIATTKGQYEAVFEPAEKVFKKAGEGIDLKTEIVTYRMGRSRVPGKVHMVTIKAADEATMHRFDGSIQALQPAYFAKLGLGPGRRAGLHYVRPEPAENQVRTTKKTPAKG